MPENEPDNKGETFEVSITVNHPHEVVIKFNEPIKWISMTPIQALDLALILMEKAKQAVAGEIEEKKDGE